MTTKLKIDGVTFHFEFRKTCEKIGEEIVEAIKKYRYSVKYAFITAFGLTPKEFTVIVKRSSKAPYVARHRIANTIILNVTQFEAIKNNILSITEKNRLTKDEFLETVYEKWMSIFLHELAHWLTPDEEEADYLANEWLSSA